jgi:hypothetical protein
MPRCTPRLIYMEHIIWCAFKKSMNGRRCSEPITTILNMWWCHLALLTRLLFFNIWWMMSFVSTQIICGLLHQWHPHFLKKIENYECHVHLVLEKLREVGLYAILEKCEFHQPKVEFLGYTILEMAFTWIFLRFRPLSIGIFQLLFKMSNVFLDLLTSIDVSLANILQKWFLLLVWLERINIFLGELKLTMPFNLWRLLSWLLHF